MKNAWVVTLTLFVFLFALQQRSILQAGYVAVTPSPTTIALTSTPLPTATPTMIILPSPTSAVVISLITNSTDTTPIASGGGVGVAGMGGGPPELPPEANHIGGQENPTHTPGRITAPDAPQAQSVEPSITPYNVVINNSTSLADQFQSWINNAFGNNQPTTSPNQNTTIVDVRKITPSPTPIGALITNIDTTNIVVTPTTYNTAPKPTPPTTSPDLSKVNGLITGKTQKDNKTELTVNTSKVGGITIVPQAYAAEVETKPLLPQEIDNSVPKSGGILVTLDQKVGGSVVTRQDAITVKRRNQLFSISNQETAPVLTQNTQTDSSEQSTNNQSTNTTQSTNTNNSRTNTVTVVPTPAPQLEIKSNDVTAQTSMTLSVDPLSGYLSVQTPSGPQRVTIMPDEALGIVSELKALTIKTGSASSMELVSENDQLMYRIPGDKVEKFLGMFPLAIQKQILVSVDTGSIIKVELSLFSRIISFFTF